MQKRLLSTLTVATAWIVFNSAPAWTQSTPESSKNQTKQGERTGEEKMEARGTQEPGRMERKKGEEEMEARGAQKPGRMGRSGAEGTQNQGGERWSKQDITKAQEALMKKGHNPGSIDGIMGPQTRKAIRAFQGANGLEQSGRLDPETADKLAVSGK